MQVLLKLAQLKQQASRRCSALWNRVAYPVNYIRARRTYDNAVRACDENFAKTGARSYLLKGKGRQLLVTTRSSFRKMKRAGYIKDTAHVLDLQQVCLYCTPYANGTGEMPKDVIDLKRQQCIAWLMR